MMRGQAIFKVAPWQLYALNNEFEHFAMFGGVGTGKSFTGAHFAIMHFRLFPDLMGFIGANTYDQLTQATLKELFTQLERQLIPFEYNRMPPKEWKAQKRLPSYQNILSVKIGHKVAYAFVRVLSDPDALRGIQFSWYWLDESRDTEQMSHDVVLSRMRESRYRKGLITTTTNGEDWTYNRLGRARKGQKLYGSLHVKTQDAVTAGILTQSYYQTLLSSYSELMIAQELNALHVNVYGGRSYYAFGPENRRFRAPWGSTRDPNPDYPLIVGADFNFDPAPHVWMVGQLSPDGTRIHWFREFSGLRKSTEDMATAIALNYHSFFIRVFGDRSGARATTSNAGVHDYRQIAKVFNEYGIQSTIDSDQTNNPLVRNRVENMNRLARDGAGNVRMTYDPERCPYFDADVKNVSWKVTTMRGQGKLDDGGNKTLTHATDGAGYAAWKVLPPGNRAKIVRGNPSLSSQLVGSK